MMIFYIFLVLLSDLSIAVDLHSNCPINQFPMDSSQRDCKCGTTNDGKKVWILASEREQGKEQIDFCYDDCNQSDSGKGLQKRSAPVCEINEVQPTEKTTEILTACQVYGKLKCKCGTSMCSKNEFCYAKAKELLTCHDHVCVHDNELPISHYFPKGSACKCFGEQSPTSFEFKCCDEKCKSPRQRKQ